MTTMERDSNFVFTFVTSGRLRKAYVRTCVRCKVNIVVTESSVFIICTYFLAIVDVHDKPGNE